MKKILLIFIFVFTGFNAYSGLWEVSLESLVENPEKYDKKLVCFKAEAIGELLSTETGKWFNVKSGKYNIGVFVNGQNGAEDIKYWGGYSQRGDTVRVEGIFYKNCGIHGKRDIHLTKLNIVEKGEAIQHSVSSQKRKLALISFIICLTTGFIYFIKRKLWKKKSEK